MYGVRNYMDLDMGIVRGGLDYYTGIVFEMYVPDYNYPLGGAVVGMIT